MGLARINGRGGFYLAARTGMLRAHVLAKPGLPGLLEAGGSGSAPPIASTQRAFAVAMGAYVLLGGWVRFGSETAVQAVGYRSGGESHVGTVIRVTVGAKL